MKKLPKGDKIRQEILEFIIEYKKENDGLSPTMREIMTACDMSSTSLVSHHLDVLVEDGHLGRTGHHRHLTVPGGRWIIGE
jgi:SOS-response transcriptional repressor LexA